MKRNFVLIVLIVMVNFAYSQDSVKKDTAWKFGGVVALTFAQTGFFDWSAGGENSMSINGRTLLFANYEKGKVSWSNSMNLAYGQSQQGNVGSRKTDDLAEVNSKLGLQAGKKWYYTGIVTARTQFANGYEYPEVDSSVLVSKPFSPLQVITALGMDYKPNKYLSIFMSPLNFTSAYVSDTTFAPRYSIESGKHARNDFGFLFRVGYKQEVIKNLSIVSRLDLMGAYDRIEGAEDVDVNWEVLLTFNVFKVLSININTHLIWDNDVKFLDSNGVPEEKSRLQFKEIFGAGIAYNF